MKIAVLCHGTVLIPAIEALHFQRMLKGIAVPEIMPSANTALREAARQMNIPVTTLYRKELAFQMRHWLKTANPDAVCMMGFPYRIPHEILPIPPLGFFNLHSGKLPQYRGPNPLFWQLKNNEKESVITIHHVESSMDTGAIAHEEPLFFDRNATYGMAMKQIGEMLPRALIAFIQKLSIHKDRLPLITQEKPLFPSFGAPGEADQMIDWNLPSEKIDALVRACNPLFFGALTSVHGVPFRVLNVRSEDGAILPGRPKTSGTVFSNHERGSLAVYCGNEEHLFIETVCVEGGFLTGRMFSQMSGIKEGDVFSPVSLRFDDLHEKNE